MIRVLIADDHPIVRRGLLQIVADQPDMTVVAETGDGREALRLAANHPLDVIVLDMSMPGLSGLEVLNQLKRVHPRVPVLILSAHPEGELALRLIKAGAAGYLNKEIAPEELAGAIRRVAGGRKYVSPALAELLADSLQGGEGPRGVAIGQGISGTAADRLRQDRLGDRRRDRAKRANDQHLPRPNPREDEHANQRRAGSLLHPESSRGLKPVAGTRRAVVFKCPDQLSAA
jgi:DNA-binding NarL/FixJ family response regulator